MQERRSPTEFMGRLEARTKELLSAIKHADLQAVQKQVEYHQLATSIIQSKSQARKLNRQDISPEGLHFPDPSPSLLLEELSAAIRKLLREKVLLSRELYNMLADSCEQFDEFVQGNQVCGQESEGYLFLQECLGNQEVSGIMLEWQGKELELMCVCGGKETSSAMIKCEGKMCRSRWYHLKCVGIKSNKVPEGSWTCLDCIREQKNAPSV